MRADDRDDQDDQPLLPSANSTPLDTTWKRVPTTVLYCFAIMVLIATSYAFAEAPLYRLYESVICKRYYRKHNPSVIGHDGTIPEAMCKIDLIQQELAMVLTKQVQLNFWASLIASSYTALIGRRFGRRLILMLNLTFYLFSQIWIYFFCYQDMAIQLTWISATFLLVASGPEMRMETIFMIMTDSTAPEDRFTIFTLGQILVLPFAIVAKKFAAFLMGHSVWIPLLLGITAILATLVILSFMPIEPLLISNVDGPREGPVKAHGHGPEDEGMPKRSPLYKNVLRQFQQTFRVLSLSRNIFFLTCTFFATSIFAQLMAGSVFLQFVEKQLQIDLANASKLQADSDAMNMISLIITSLVFGKLGTILIGRGPLISVRDITISRFCAIMMALGFSVIGMAQGYGLVLSGLLFCAAGQAFRMSTRSSLTSMTEDPTNDNITGLFTIIYYMDLAGGASINFILAVSFTEGLKRGGRWIGLPFFCAALVWSVVAFITLCVKVMPLNIVQRPSSSTSQLGSSASSELLLGVSAERPEEHSQSGSLRS